MGFHHVLQRKINQLEKKKKNSSKSKMLSRNHVVLVGCLLAWYFVKRALVDVMKHMQ